MPASDEDIAVLYAAARQKACVRCCYDADHPAGEVESVLRVLNVTTFDEFLGVLLWQRSGTGVGKAVPGRPQVVREFRDIVAGSVRPLFPITAVMSDSTRKDPGRVDMAASERDIARLKAAAGTCAIVMIRYRRSSGGPLSSLVLVREVKPLGVVGHVVWSRFAEGCTRYLLDRDERMTTGLYFEEIAPDSVRPLFPAVRPWTAEARP